MTKLGKYLKPFALSILAIVALLFTQAVCGLAMPGYISSIVDVGIVSGGMEDGVPSVIRENEVKRLVPFMNKKEQKVFTDNYTRPISERTTDDQLDTYPILKKGNVYELKDMDSATRDTIKGSLRKAKTTVTRLEQSATEVKSGKSSFSKESSDEQKRMMKLLPSLSKKMDILTVLETMSSRQLMDMKQEVNKVTDAMRTETVDTTNAAYVRNEYKAIGIDVDAIQYIYLSRHGFMILAVALGSAAAAAAAGFLAAHIVAGVSRSLRRDVFNKVEHFSSAEFNKLSTNTLITRATNNIQQIQMALIVILRIVIYAPVIGTDAMIKAVNTSVSMTWIIAFVVVLILGIMMVAFAFVVPKFKILQKLIDKLNSVVREILDGILVIRTFNNQKYESEKFAEADGGILRANSFTIRAMACLTPLVMLIMNYVSILIVWISSYRIDSGALQVGDMMAFIQYAIQIITTLIVIAMISIVLPRVGTAAQCAMEIPHTKPGICDPLTAEHFNEAKHDCIGFHHVSFRCPGTEEDVLHDINFTAQPGKTAAFIGSTRSGKSTIINLIPRFLDVTEGSTLVDGVDVRKVSQHDLREKIGCVPKKGSLFTGTIASNLRYARGDATTTDMEEAASVAQALDLIDGKQERFDAPIVQGGANISGGQRRRLSIARALVKKPEIYIFDDTFSALDFRTDARLREALNELYQKTRSTVLLVAQRISSIMHAQRIIVLDKGQVAGIDTHKELMKSRDVYREIAYSQLSKEELESE